MAFLDKSHGVVVAAENIENWVVKEFRCARHLKRNVRQVCHGKSWRDRDIVEMCDEPAQSVERTIRAERAVVVGEGNKCSLIEGDSELFVQFSD